MNAGIVKLRITLNSDADDPEETIEEALKICTEIESEQKTLESKLAVAVAMLEHLSNFRQEAHAYDRDVQQPLREFDEEEIIRVEDMAKEALTRMNPASWNRTGIAKNPGD